MGFVNEEVVFKSNNRCFTTSVITLGGLSILAKQLSLSDDSWIIAGILYCARAFTGTTWDRGSSKQESSVETESDAVKSVSWQWGAREQAFRSGGGGGGLGERIVFCVREKRVDSTSL